MSSSILRRYTPPTCTLEIQAKASPLSRWFGGPVLKQLQFDLSFDDPRLPEEKRIALHGDQIQLEALQEVVEAYVKDFLTLAPETLNAQLLATAADEAEPQNPSITPPSPLHSQQGAIDPELVSTDTSDVEPAEPVAEFLLATPSAAEITGISLQPHDSLTHNLFLGSLATETSGSVVRLTMLQLFDLANALEEYAAEVLALPNPKPVKEKTAVSRLLMPVWARTAAILLVTVGLGTGVFKLLARTTSNPETSAPTISQATNPLDPLQVAPEASSTQTLLLPPSASTLPTLPPPPNGVAVLPTPGGAPPAGVPASPSPGVSLPAGVAVLPTPGGAPPARVATSPSPTASPPITASLPPTVRVTPTLEYKLPFNRGSETGGPSNPTNARPTQSPVQPIPSAAKPRQDRPVVAIPAPLAEPPVAPAAVAPKPPQRPPVTALTTPPSPRITVPNAVAKPEVTAPATLGNPRMTLPTLEPQPEVTAPTTPPSVAIAPPTPLTLPEIADHSIEEGTASKADPSVAAIPSTPAPQPEASSRQARVGDSSNVFDAIPQVTEARKYFQQRWQPPSSLTQDLEYSLSLNPDGSIKSIIPRGQAAEIYLDRTEMPLIGESFVSPLEGGRSATIVVVLSKDGKVQTFLASN